MMIKVQRDIEGHSICHLCGAPIVNEIEERTLTVKPQNDEKLAFMTVCHTSCWWSACRCVGIEARPTVKVSH